MSGDVFIVRTPEELAERGLPESAIPLLPIAVWPMRNLEGKPDGFHFRLSHIDDFDPEGGGINGIDLDKGSRIDHQLCSLPIDKESVADTWDNSIQTSRNDSTSVDPRSDQVDGIAAFAHSASLACPTHEKTPVDAPASAGGL